MSKRSARFRLCRGQEHSPQDDTPLFSPTSLKIYGGQGPSLYRNHVPPMRPAMSITQLILSAAQQHGDGARIDLVTYPSAYHGFNSPQLQPGISFFGHWLEYDKHAATDAWAKVNTFLATNPASSP
jgi:hypothetical protein